MAGVLLLCSGCGMPRDPEGTLARVQGGRLRVGVSESPPWVASTDGEPQGLEPDLLRGFAKKHGAQIDWFSGTEARLMEDLDQRRLDVVIAGFDDETPWTTHGGMTAPYATWEGRRHVMLVPLGENRLLLELDRWLQSQTANVLADLLESEEEAR